MKQLATCLILLLSANSFCQEALIDDNKRTFRFQEIGLDKLSNEEFAEVVSTSTDIGRDYNNDYACRIVACCNGPSDPKLEYCNCSTNYYIANGTFDLPNEFNLFKIGPFYSVDTAYISKGESINSFNFTIVHNRDNTLLTSEYIVEFEKIFKKK